MSSKYWSKLDLHQHTNHDIDCDGRLLDHQYTHKDYYEWLKEQKVDLKAVTNHNNIDIAEHIKHAIISDMLKIKHLVGVEIDYCFDSLKFQAITILSPNVDIIKFANELNKIRNLKGNKVCLNVDDFSKLHKETEFIFIPHAIKEKGILEKQIGELEISTLDWVVKALISGLGEPILFENTHDYHVYSIPTKIKHTLNSVDLDIEIGAYVGSDYKFDNDSERKQKIIEKPRYSILSTPTYRGLELAIRNPLTRLSLDDQIVNRNRFIESIEILNHENFTSNTLTLSPSLNVIIGSSGTGKTLLLNEIYKSIKDMPLKAAQKDEKDKNPYYQKTKNKQIIDIKFDKGTNAKDIKIVEIPNIYSEILKTQENDDSIKKLFGINDINSAESIILEYKDNINNYHNDLARETISEERAKKNIENIFSAVNFINKNRINKNVFNLKTHLVDDLVLKKLTEKLTEIEKYIMDQVKIQNYFTKLKNFFSKDDDKKLIDKLLKIYVNIIESLIKEKYIIEKQLKLVQLDSKIIDSINENIRKSINLLGNKEKTVADRREVVDKEIKSLLENLTETIKASLEQLKYKLEFPYTKLKTELETNNNKYARVTLNDDKFQIKDVDLADNPLINLPRIKSKVSDLGLNKINFLKDVEVKKVVRKLFTKLNINLSDIISSSSEIPTNVEIYNSERNEWKLLKNTNKGDIAKKSMEYYFNDLIKNEQPNIIVIDQPENDVDKGFITDTLSTFIKEQKIDKQIIITSHDPIVTINSDVNKVIESSIVENNKFNYIAYDLELVENNILEGTNRVSKLLDGNKNNVKKRYQIYGGELNYENRNI